jgi:hypothetical protein
MQHNERVKRCGIHGQDHLHDKPLKPPAILSIVLAVNPHNDMMPLTLVH